MKKHEENRKEKEWFSVFSWASKHGDGKRGKKGKNFYSRTWNSLAHRLVRRQSCGVEKWGDVEEWETRLTQFFSEISEFSRKPLKLSKLFPSLRACSRLFAQQNKRFIWSWLFTSRNRLWFDAIDYMESKIELLQNRLMLNCNDFCFVGKLFLMI